MFRLDINTKRAKAAIVRRPDLLLSDDPRRLHQPLAHFFRALHSRVQRVDDADKGLLGDAVGVGAEGRGDLLVDGRFVGFGGELDEEVAGVHGEEGGEEVGIGDFARVDAVAVAAGAGVDADILAFGGGEAVEHSGRGDWSNLGGMEGWRGLLVVEVDECLEEVGACPWIARVFLGCKATFGEIHGDSFGTGFEATSDIFLALLSPLV